MPAAAPARSLAELNIHQQQHFLTDASLPAENNRSSSSKTLSETGALSETSAPRHLYLVPATTTDGNSATPIAAAEKSPTENSAAENSASPTPKTGTPEVRPTANQADEGATLRGRHRRQPLLLRLVRDDSGLSTAEYAVATVAACAFAAVLFRILTGNEVVGLVTGLIRRGLDVIQ